MTKNEKGKSDILNQIFHTRFISQQNRHHILSSSPEVHLRIYENKYPVNLIDIGSLTN